MYLGAVFIDILLNEYFPKFVFNKNLSFNTEHELMFVCFNPGFTQPLQSSRVAVRFVVLSYIPKVVSLGVLLTEMCYCLRLYIPTIYIQDIRESI